MMKSSFDSDPYLPSVHARPKQVSCGIHLRPDVVVMRFQCTMENLTPIKALERMEGGIGMLRRSLEALHRSAEVRMLDVNAHRTPEKKKSKSPSPTPHATTVAGEVRLPFSPQQDFWTRAKLVAKLYELGQALAEEGQRQTPHVLVSYSKPVAQIDAPESHRDALIAAWVQSMNALAQAAQSASAPLHIVDCHPRGPIEQHAHSLEDVELTLSLAGRLDTLASGAPKEQ